MAERVVVFENSVQNQKQELAAAAAQLTGVARPHEWLIASFYKPSNKERVRYMQDRYTRWAAALDEVIASLPPCQGRL